MATIDFDVSQSAYKPKQIDFKAKEPIEKTKVMFHGVSDDGITSNFSIEGPSELVEKMLMPFPIGKGAKGISFKLTLDSTQTTITSAIANATKDAAAAQAAQAKDDDQTLNTLEAEVNKMSA